MSARKYFTEAIEALKAVDASQQESIGVAAEMLVEAVTGGKSIFAFGAGHSFMLAEEMVYRTGGLMLVNPIYPHGMNLSVRPITATSLLERLPGLGAELLAGSPASSGDVLIIASTSGRNAAGIDMALAATERGIKTICITSFAYSASVKSRHSSGRRLMEICDVAIDNGAPAGDAAVEVPGFAQRVGPLSSVTGCAVANALVSEVVDRLVKLGITPPVFVSANVDEGDAHNARLMKENMHRIHYLD